jgi:Fe(3+) dicitrate transport protein
MKKLHFQALAVSTLLVMSSPSYAEEMSPVSVFGSQDETQQAGSAHYISDEEMKAMGYTDAERVLNRIPGVYSQTEDGYGLRTNLGMRGTSALRTTKINVLEDGVPQGPAIYSNGSMYFFPDVGRMEGVEVLKGPAAIGTGPRTTAGTINFLSRSIPTTGAEGHYSITGGDDGFSRNHTYYGGNIGSIGYVFEYHDYRADGYKNIKGTGNNTDSGFDKQTDLTKLRYTPANSAWNQTFEIMSSNTSETSNETYIGLTGADFQADPFQRYGVSSIDQMDNDYHRYIFTHTMQPAANMTVTSKLYKTRYSRIWGKSGGMYVDRDDLDGLGLTDYVGFGDIDMKGNCAGDSGAELRACNILTNDTAMVANEYIKRSMGHRDYGMTGVQFVINHQIGNHALEYGYRRHKDYRSRADSGFSQNWSVDGNNTMTLLRENGNDNSRFADAELKDTDAESYHIKDIISAGPFTHTVGLRYEDTEKNDGTNANPGNSKTDVSDSQTMIGLATVYNMGNGTSVFAGFHEGFSPVDAGSSASIEPEKSDNFEIGFRKQSAGSYFEVIAFLNDYDQLIDTCLEANGCTAGTGSTTNKGAAEVEGIEFQYRLDNMFAAPEMKGMATTSSVRYPLMISGMLQSSEYTGGETTFSGKSIAYVPDFQMYTSIGMETNNWSIALGAKYLDDTFTNDANTFRTGKAFIFDLHSGMNIPVNTGGIQNARLFFNVDNLFDKVIVASEHEYGKRPNKPLSVMAGVKFDF